MFAVYSIEVGGMYLNGQRLCCINQFNQNRERMKKHSKAAQYLRTFRIQILLQRFAV